MFFLSAVTTHSPTLRHVLCVAKPPERIAAELLFFLSAVTTHAPALRHVLCVANRAFQFGQKKFRFDNLMNLPLVH